MEEIIEELTLTNKWLSSEYKNSNYYREYLDKVNEDLKIATKYVN
jgi:FtsZ-binding cell division protein ZapB